MNNQQTNERIETLDVLRGMALIGIFIVNISLMKSMGLLEYAFGIGQQKEGLDYGLSLLRDLFIEGSFISIFSFLFGLGFYIFMDRASGKGFSANKLFIRRLFFLLIFGLVHLVFFWMGDILFYYALTGFLLLFFYRRKTKTILISAFVSLGAFFLLLSSQLFIPESMFRDIQQDGHTFINQANDVYPHAPSMEWFMFRLQNEIPLVLSQVLFLIPFVLGLFLLGFYAGRKGWFHKPAEHVSFFRRLRNVSLVITIPFWLVMILTELAVIDLGFRNIYLYDLVMRMGAVSLAFTYIAVIALWMQSGRSRGVLSKFGTMGKMALTNYLMQTVLMLTIIYSFNLYGNLALWQGLLIVLGIVIFQIYFSQYWLSRLRFGPMEWVWRKLTYGGHFSAKK